MDIKNKAVLVLAAQVYGLLPYMHPTSRVLSIVVQKGFEKMSLSEEKYNCSRLCPNSRTMLLGVTLTLAANALHLLASYLVKVNTISATDNLIFRASVQTVGFGIWTFGNVIYIRRQRTNYSKLAHFKIL